MTNDSDAQIEAFVPKINDFAQKYIEGLQKERDRLKDDFPLCAVLIENVIDRVHSSGRVPGKQFKADVFQQKPIKLTQGVFLPVKQYPKFNFQGKILGPKGNTLKRLHEENMCSISIKGRNSMRDHEKEEALRASANPAFNHLNKNLYLEVSTVAPPAEAYARVANALTEIRKYVIPDKNDEISQEQYRELMQIDPKLVNGNFGNNPQRTAFGKDVSNRASVQYNNENVDNSPKQTAPPQFIRNESSIPAGKFKNARPHPTKIHLLKIRTKKCNIKLRV